MYSEFIGDPLIQSLAFEDQRHYVGILCMKCSGLLDKEFGADTREKIIAKGLGLDIDSAKEVKRRLCDVGLVDSRWQPSAWDKRQFSERHGVSPADPAGRAYAYFIGEQNGKLVKIGYSKNPWARLKDFQTASAGELRVLATVSTTENSESHLHDLFEASRKGGEWFEVNGEISSVIKKINKSHIKTDHDVVNYVAQLRSTTTDTDTDTDTEVKPLASRAKPRSAEAPVNGNAVAYIPLNDGSEFGISAEQLSEFEKLYPAVDVPQTLNEIRAWNLTHPDRRKTKRGVMAHVNGWLAKEQNRGPKA